jgi:hypothetical protein
MKNMMIMMMMVVVMLKLCSSCYTPNNNLSGLYTKLFYYCLCGERGWKSKKVLAEITYDPLLCSVAQGIF